MYLNYEKTAEGAVIKSPMRVRVCGTDAITKREQTTGTKTGQYQHDGHGKKLTKTISTPNTLSISQRLLEILA